MRALHVSLHALRTKHAAIERKLFPRLKADDLIAADLELNAALLTAKTAVGLHEFFRRILSLALPAAGRLIFQMRPITFGQHLRINRRPCHATPFSIAIESWPATFVCTRDKRPAMSGRCVITRNRSQVLAALFSNPEH